jgi:O-antigen/teichoic acid export membrane protein
VLKKKKILLASTLVMLAFGLSQIIRLGSNLIVTRILEPEMFGVMAVVYVLIQGIGMFSDLGLWAFIVRHENHDDPHLLNSVWTIQVIRGWGMFFIVLIAALILYFGNLFSTNYFQGIYANPQLPTLIVIAGISSIISGYKSMASPVMHRKLELGKLEIVELISQIAGVSVMLLWVWLYPSIWALLSAGIVSTSVSTILGYRLFPFRHKFILDKAVNKEVFQFSKWIVIASALTYLFSQGDKLFFAAKIDASTLGVYSIAVMLVASLTSITETLASKIVFPIFSSQAQGDRQALKRNYYRVRLYLDFPIFLVAGILIAIAPLLIETLYDNRYTQASSMLQILVFSMIGNSLSLVSMECLSALSITKIRMWVMLIRTISLFIGLPLFFSLYGYYGAVWVVALNVWMSLPIIYWTLAKNSVFTLLKELRMLPAVILGYYLGIIVLSFFE